MEQTQHDIIAGIKELEETRIKATKQFLVDEEDFIGEPQLR